MIDTDIVRYSCGHEFEYGVFLKDGLGRLFVQKNRPCWDCTPPNAIRGISYSDKTYDEYLDNEI